MSNSSVKTLPSAAKYPGTGLMWRRRGSTVFWKETELRLWGNQNMFLDPYQRCWIDHYEEAKLTMTVWKVLQGFFQKSSWSCLQMHISDLFMILRHAASPALRLLWTRLRNAHISRGGWWGGNSLGEEGGNRLPISFFFPLLWILEPPPSMSAPTASECRAQCEIQKSCRLFTFDSATANCRWFYPPLSE